MGSFKLLTEKKEFTPVSLSLTFETQNELDFFTAIAAKWYVHNFSQAHELFNALIKAGGHHTDV